MLHTPHPTLLIPHAIDKDNQYALCICLCFVRVECVQLYTVYIKRAKERSGSLTVRPSRIRSECGKWKPHGHRSHVTRHSVILPHSYLLTTEHTWSYLHTLILYERAATCRISQHFIFFFFFFLLLLAGIALQEDDLHFHGDLLFPSLFTYIFRFWRRS